ncbi:Chromosome transmission fidelity protein 18, partial [Coemansia nantahalensis]
MSVGNLEESQVARTSLDDWESCIYLLCWLGASGVNDDDQKRYKNNPMDAILLWRNGGKRAIAKAKRNHMDSTRLFKNNILAEFIVDGRYDGLRDLAMALHKTLFFNAKVSPLCRGSFVNDDALKNLDEGKLSLKDFLDANVGIDVSVDKKATDPFARRAKFADEIADDLMKTLFEARNKAKARLQCMPVPAASTSKARPAIACRPGQYTLPPESGDFITTRTARGKTLYFAVRTEVDMAKQMDRIASLVGDARPSSAQINRMVADIESDLDMAAELRDSAMDQDAADPAPDRPSKGAAPSQLWVDKYRARGFLDLISDARTNR